jgi:hypothetical protein
MLQRLFEQQMLGNYQKILTKKTIDEKPNDTAIGTPINIKQITIAKSKKSSIIFSPLQP